MTIILSWTFSLSVNNPPNCWGIINFLSAGYFIIPNIQMAVIVSYTIICTKIYQNSPFLFDITDHHKPNKKMISS